MDHSEQGGSFWGAVLRFLLGGCRQHEFTTSLITKITVPPIE